MRTGHRTLLPRLLAATLLAGCGLFHVGRMSRDGTDVLLSAPKPPPVDSEFEGCGPTGSQPDYVLNRRKNRVDEPPRDESIVVEITPRVRVHHPAWTAERLDAFQKSRVPLRVRGWLMLDQMHPEKIERNRRTLWEVHPVMELERQRADSSWVSLDSLAPPPNPG